MPPSTPFYPPNSPLSTPAVEDYCLLKYSDRYRYRSRREQVESELLGRFDNAKPSTLEIAAYSEFFNRNFSNPSEIRFSEDDLFGYAYRENGHKKLISVFYINNFRKKA